MWLVKRLLLLNTSNCGHIRQHGLSYGSLALKFSFFSDLVVIVQTSIEHLSQMLVCECTPSVSHTSHRCIDINQPVMNSGGSSDSSRKLCFLPY